MTLLLHDAKIQIETGEIVPRQVLQDKVSTCSINLESWRDTDSIGYDPDDDDRFAKAGRTQLHAFCKYVQWLTTRSLVPELQVSSSR